MVMLTWQKGTKRMWMNSDGDTALRLSNICSQIWRQKTKSSLFNRPKLILWKSALCSCQLFFIYCRNSGCRLWWFADTGCLIHMPTGEWGEYQHLFFSTQSTVCHQISCMQSTLQPLCVDLLLWCLWCILNNLCIGILRVLSHWHMENLAVTSFLVLHSLRFML